MHVPDLELRIRKLLLTDEDETSGYGCGT